VLNTCLGALGVHRPAGDRAWDRLEIVVLPILLGDGIPLSPPGSPPLTLRLLRADRTFPDGAVELVYTPA
jgi:hypothetical protein